MQETKPLDYLISNIKSEVNLLPDHDELIKKSFKVKTLKRKEVVLYKGDVSSHMRFIAQGCLRAYYLDEQAKEHVIQFGIEGWWINDLYSYLTQTPARQFIQAIEPSLLVQVHRDSLLALFDQVPSVERFFRLKFEKAYVALQDRTINSLSKSAEERYEEFCKEHRDLEQRIPQYMLASYLGITPEFLSALRKNR